MFTSMQNTPSYFILSLACQSFTTPSWQYDVLLLPSDGSKSTDTLGSDNKTEAIKRKTESRSLMHIPPGPAQEESMESLKAWKGRGAAGRF
jgi:hypothetical protein